MVRYDKDFSVPQESTENEDVGTEGRENYLASRLDEILSEKRNPVFIKEHQVIFSLLCLAADPHLSEADRAQTRIRLYKKYPELEDELKELLSQIDQPLDDSIKN